MHARARTETYRVSMHLTCSTVPVENLSEVVSGVSLSARFLVPAAACARAPSPGSAAAAGNRPQMTYGEKEHAKMSRCGAMTSGWALLMMSKVGIGYNMVTDSTVGMGSRWW